MSQSDHDEEEPLRSVNHSERDLGAGSASGVRAVPAPLAPFLVLVAAFGVVLAVLGALSVYVGGCESAPAACFADAVAAAHAATIVGAVNFSSSSTPSVRVRVAATPEFLLNFTFDHELLGAANVFAVLSNSSASSSAAVNDEASAAFVVRRGAFWLSSSQDVGQFSRLNLNCSCGRAVRSTLGSALATLTTGANNSSAAVHAAVFQNNSAAASAVVETALVRDKWNLAATTALLALPTAVLVEPALTLLFVDLATQDKDQPAPQFNRSVVAVGQLFAPPFEIANLTSTFDLRPSAVQRRAGDAAVYFHVRRAAAGANCTAGCYTVARVASVEAVLSEAPQIEYLASIDATNASLAHWTSNATSAVAPSGFDCAVASLFHQFALCVAGTRVELVQLSEPWAGSVVVGSLLSSSTNTTFLGATFHPETYAGMAPVGGNFSTVGFSTVSNDTSLQAFWLLDFKGVNF